MFALDETIHCSLQAVLITEVIAGRGCMSEKQCANYFKISFVFFFARIVFPPLFIWALMHTSRMHNAISLPVSLQSHNHFYARLVGGEVKAGEDPASFLSQVPSFLAVLIISLRPRDITFLVSFAMKEMFFDEKECKLWLFLEMVSLTYSLGDKMCLEKKKDDAQYRL